MFEEEKLISMGSTFNKTTDAWNIVSIRTLPEYRGKGYASDVTSTLVELGLEHVRTVSLTVVKDNEATIACYSKLGFLPAGDRVWIDNGTGAKP